MQVEKLGRLRSELSELTKSWEGRDVPMTLIRSVYLFVCQSESLSLSRCVCLRVCLSLACVRVCRCLSVCLFF